MGAPLWSPHWLFSEYDFKFLQDPKKTFGGVKKIYHAIRHGFDKILFRSLRMTEELEDD
ncbi:glycine betaine ABC transporter substrate-binding protein [Halobacillus yeomjeoni]|uniref:glycine betaine ABC transporter substrate-binding protein n=1 Tax=Halobacillus yeomjeoni TaxID=311194 RepID=UPI002E1A12CA|nr:glycine betaine ABC transporter substrate-binding protein [Halobacillus yeomjeoni]